MSNYSVSGLGADHQNMLDSVVERASKDEAFRKTLVDSPKSAIKAETGIDVPEGVDIRFVENEGADLTVVLPDVESEEISDSDLESVAGGDAWIDVSQCNGDNNCISDKTETKEINN